MILLCAWCVLSLLVPLAVGRWLKDVASAPSGAH